MNDDFPVSLSVDYPDRDLNRLTTAFRILAMIPIIIVLFLPPLLMIVFQQKYPRWWFWTS